MQAVDDDNAEIDDAGEKIVDGEEDALRAHMAEAATDWLNPLSLGIMSYTM